MITLIIPFYNCENTVSDTLNKVKNFREKYIEPIEFIAVNDGSTDNTLSLLCADTSVKVISYEKNKGKGGAIKAGVEAANGDKIIFTDADLAYGLDIISEFSKSLDEFDIVAGTRRCDKEIQKSYGFIRNISSNAFSAICELFLRTGIDDTQCGIKGYRSQAAKELFSDLCINGFGFDLEILATARAKNMTVTQLPVKLLTNEKNSKVNLINDGLKMLSQLILIRRKVKKI